MPLWLDWAFIAEKSAAAASVFEQPDEVIDDMSAALAGLPRRDTRASPSPEEDGLRQHQLAMIAVAGAAHAVDGFYGSVKPFLVLPSRRGRPARARVILEGLKIGFAIGRQQTRWLHELDWLFEARDGGVHHAEELRPVVVGRVTAETVVMSGIEAYNFSASSARRAADLAREILLTCLEHPRAATRQWSEERLQGAAERLRAG